MIRHSKLTKSNIPNIFNTARKKTTKKIMTSCGTPRKIFSKSTSRNGSPYPSTCRIHKQTTVQIPKLKLSATSPRLKLSSLLSYTSTVASIHKGKKPKKPKYAKICSKNLSPRGMETAENLITHCSHEIIDLKQKHAKSKIENSDINQLKLMLQQVMLENSNMKNKLRKQSESQEEPKSAMNSSSIEAAFEQLKSKLECLKIKIS